MPSDSDLRRLIRFSTDDGLIWLGEQRMVLLHLSALQAVRRELVASVGPAHARKLFMRAGYTAGAHDALIARQVRPNASLADAFAVGPQLHMLEGAAHVTLTQFDIDEDADHFLIKVRWDDSWEAQAHSLESGEAAQQPGCWMLLGYASGYTSQFFQRAVLFQETQCAACGATHCEIEGRYSEEWPDGTQLARDYDEDHLLTRLEQLHSQVEALRGDTPPCDDQGPLIGQSAAFQKTIQLLRQAAPTKVGVLLTGETGVGKERFARALHALSPRADKPFVAINCAALPSDLIESELFGAEKGAYTGAGAARAGRFERADGGTLMLDELGDLPLPAQAKLLRVLQSGEIERLGGHETRRIDVRVIAATNVNLEQAVAQGRFRADLLYRLNVYPIRIPPLRERPEDIELLARHLLQQLTRRHGKQVAGLSDRALDALRRYTWPGNVRELENLIERGLILTPPGQSIDATALFPNLAEQDASVSVDRGGQLRSQPEPPADLAASILDLMAQTGLSLDALEDGLFDAAVDRAGGSVSAAARSVGLTRAQLSYRLTQRRKKSST